ncbi:MAG TPA: glutathionylspermidine synthase family protein [Campylobacterales bacterium]|nr:glutathionylspermidine synthase family protein [Campylobacterales bacterium]
MVKLEKVQPISNEILENIGLKWHTDLDGTSYIADEVVTISEQEAEEYYKATNTLYDMFVEAGEYVIENNLFHELGIPFNLVPMIKFSWENDPHWHLYGRFDLAGGIDGKPIKLIEFNADTPTGLLETSVIQWAILKSNNIEDRQFNNVYQAISDNFKRLIVGDGDLKEFPSLYQGWKILFSSYEGIAEEEETTRLLQQMAIDAGFITDFEYLHKVQFSENGIFNSRDEEFQYWFKLFPWEDIGFEEPKLVPLLEKIILNRRAIVLNPPYTLLFQSKGILKILWDLFPNSPYLLETSFKPLQGKSYIEKKVFGREGANTKIYDSNHNLITSTDGEYDHYKSIFQEYIEFPQDEKGNRYQAGVFFAYEGCGLAFRRGGQILDNMSKFVGHRIVD